MTTRRKFIGSSIMGGLGGIISSSVSPTYIKNIQARESMISLEEARKLHDEVIIFDAHNDTTVERVARGQNVSTLLQFDKDYQTDIPRMNTVGYDAGCFIVGNGVIAKNKHWK